jgi:hypothetical protein
LQRQPDRQRGGAKHGQDRSRLHAELLKHRDQTYGDDQIAHQRGGEGRKRSVCGMVTVDLFDPAFRSVGKALGGPERNREDEARHEHSH